MKIRIPLAVGWLLLLGAAPFFHGCVKMPASKEYALEQTKALQAAADAVYGAALVFRRNQTPGGDHAYRLAAQARQKAYDLNNRDAAFMDSSLSAFAGGAGSLLSSLLPLVGGGGGALGLAGIGMALLQSKKKAFYAKLAADLKEMDKADSQAHYQKTNGHS